MSLEYPAPPTEREQRMYAVIVELREALETALSAMEKSLAIGCTDHLDAGDDAGKFWHEATDRARAAIAKAKGEA